MQLREFLEKRFPQKLEIVSDGVRGCEGGQGSEFGAWGGGGSGQLLVSQTGEPVSIPNAFEVLLPDSGQVLHSKQVRGPILVKGLRFGVRGALPGPNPGY